MPSYAEQLTAIGKQADADLAAAKAERDAQRARADIAETKLAALQAGQTPPVVVPPVTPATEPPVVVGGGPTSPIAPRNPHTVGSGVELVGGKKAIADTIFAPDATAPFEAALMIRADGATVDRVTITKPKHYGVYIEGAQGVKVTDLKLIGPSHYQSSIRTARGTGQTKAPSVTFTRCDLSAPNNGGLGRAGFRGEGTRTFIDCRVADLQWASGGLANDDGGDKHGRARTIDAVFDNALTIDTAIAAAAPKDRAGVLAAIRAAKPMVGGKPYNLTDDIWNRTMAYRDAEAGGWSRDTWHNCLCLAQIGLMAGADVTLDGTNEIRVSGKVFLEYTLEYPRKSNLLPGDKPRAAPIFRGNGDKITAPGGWGCPASILRGWFMVNGKREDYGN